METREGSNSVSTPQELSSRKNIITLPQSSLKFEGGQYYIVHRRKVYKVSLEPSGLYKYRTFGMTWFVEVV
jgi:hypothetical protein